MPIRSPLFALTILFAVGGVACATPIETIDDESRASESQVDDELDSETSKPKATEICQSAVVRMRACGDIEKCAILASLPEVASSSEIIVKTCRAKSKEKAKSPWYDGACTKAIEDLRNCIAASTRKLRLERSTCEHRPSPVRPAIVCGPAKGK
jgi:hypothetical protein